jgi:hypothetical protein
MYGTSGYVAGILMSNAALWRACGAFNMGRLVRWVGIGSRCVCAVQAGRTNAPCAVWWRLGRIPGGWRDGGCAGAEPVEGFQTESVLYWSADGSPGYFGPEGRKRAGLKKLTKTFVSGVQSTYSRSPLQPFLPLVALHEISNLQSFEEHGNHGEHIMRMSMGEPVGTLIH